MGQAEGVVERVGGEGDWIAVCRLDEIVDGRGLVRHVNGAEVAVMRDGATAFAIGNLCPHRGGQLGDGRVEDGRAVCPLHGWDFDLRTGVSPYNPDDVVPAYPTRLRDGAVEVDASAVPAAPPRPDVYLGPWIRRGAADRGMHDVHGYAAGAGADVQAMGSLRLERSGGRRPSPSLDDIVFKPAQLDRLPLLGDVEVDTSVTLGTRARRPLRLELPLFVSHMSYGALGAEAKEALARGASAAGTAIASGEGGSHPREREHATRYVFEMASGYFGWTPDVIAAAHAIEVKIGQGAKPGLGGTLLGSKVTPEIARVRGVEPGQDVHSPARFPDIGSVAELARRVDEIRELTGGVPIGVKFAGGDVERDVAAALEAGADYITVDGLGGGTGAAPLHVKDHVGIPSPFTLVRARRFLDAQGVHDVQLVATGGFRTPDEMAKALALGADAVALATASLMAIGCQQYRACQAGTCPVGIATQDPRLRGRLDVAESAARLERFLRTCTALMTDYARICGRRRLADLCHADVATLDADVARATDLEWVL
jgi:glutamate synthase domain-containing protein 2/nitrite reductase/ring-hydroxylating ferredoxin subunit